jgi:hypothetical protein
VLQLPFMILVYYIVEIVTTIVYIVLILFATMDEQFVQVLNLS